ncbi:Uracil permease @ Uracil:proton symporter UraA [Pseudomonas sp. FEN]|nr:Uracil permease @ Uracil:proton symporter UraA [Pseudomonas sp. FEN]
MLTKTTTRKIMTWAAIFAISLAFIGKFGALLQSIPVPVPHPGAGSHHTCPSPSSAPPPDRRAGGIPPPAPGLQQPPNCR